jgi:uncharacterized membrane protein
VIPILPTTESDVARLSIRIKRLQEQGLTHSLKKASSGKKRKKQEKAAPEAGKEVMDQISLTEVEKNAPLGASKVVPPPHGLKSAGIKNSATASLTAKVMEEQQQRNKRRKQDVNENLGSLFTSKDSKKSSGSNTDFMTRGYAFPAHARR